MSTQLDADADRLTLAALLDAQHKAERLFDAAIERGFLVAGQTENALSEKIYDLGHEMFGTRRHWHKRLVRAGANTLAPYSVRTPDLVLREDEIFFLDFGPVFRGWEADVGRTYVLGQNPDMLRLASDVQAAWHAGHEFAHANRTATTADLFAFTQDWGRARGWEYSGPHCGHHVGRFPHERIIGDEAVNYLCADNVTPIHTTDRSGRQVHWIYEIHFIDRAQQIGGFFEQLLTDRPLPQDAASPSAPQSTT